MRTTLIGGLILILMSLGGGGPAVAVPRAPELPDSMASPFVLSIRHHHRHHHHHGRHWRSGGWDYGSPEASLPGIEGQSVPAPAYSDPGAAASSAPASPNPGGSDKRPSIRWVNPDRATR